MKIKLFQVFIAGIFIMLLVSCNEKTNYLRIWYDHPADASVPDKKEGWQNDPEWMKVVYGNKMIDIAPEEVKIYKTNDDFIIL